MVFQYVQYRSKYIGGKAKIPIFKCRSKLKAQETGEKGSLIKEIKKLRIHVLLFCPRLFFCSYVDTILRNLTFKYVFLITNYLPSTIAGFFYYIVNSRLGCANYVCKCILDIFKYHCVYLCLCLSLSLFPSGRLYIHIFIHFSIQSMISIVHIYYYFLLFCSTFAAKKQWNFPRKK